MKKIRLIPIGIAGCLALGIGCNLATGNNDTVAASVKDVIDVDDSFVDSLILGFAKQDGIGSTTAGDISALAAGSPVAYANDSEEQDDKKDNTDNTAAARVAQDYAEASEVKPTVVSNPTQTAENSGSTQIERSEAVPATPVQQADTFTQTEQSVEEDDVSRESETPAVESGNIADSQGVSAVRPAGNSVRRPAENADVKGEISETADEGKGTETQKDITEEEKEVIEIKDDNSEDKILGEIVIDPGSGWESTYQAGEEISSNTSYVYPDRTVTFYTHSLTYYNNPAADSTTYGISGIGEVDRDTYMKEVEKCRADMEAGLCNPGDRASSLAPIIFRDKVMDVVDLDDGIEWFDEDESGEAHEHEWTPVYKTVHHDAVTHTEEVWVSIVDNNGSYEYADAEGNTVGYLGVVGTIITYENDEIVSVKNEETEGNASLYDAEGNLLAEFAPGEEYNVQDYFDTEIAPLSAMIGPAFSYIEDREIVDEEAYDEEVIDYYICEECGETE